MRRLCTKCDDVMGTQTFVQAFFELYFRLADEEGTTLEVSVADERVCLPSFRCLITWRSPLTIRPVLHPA